MPRRDIPGNQASGIPSSRKLKNLEGIEEGPSVFTEKESQKRSPGPSTTTYPPPKQLRLQFYTFVLRGRTLFSGKAEERSFFYVSSSRNGAERHVGPELRGCGQHGCPACHPNFTERRKRLGQGPERVD